MMGGGTVCGSSLKNVRQHDAWLYQKIKGRSLVPPWIRHSCYFWLITKIQIFKESSEIFIIKKEIDRERKKVKEHKEAYTFSDRKHEWYSQPHNHVHLCVGASWCNFHYFSFHFLQFFYFILGALLLVQTMQSVHHVKQLRWTSREFPSQYMIIHLPEPKHSTSKPSLGVKESELSTN